VKNADFFRAYITEDFDRYVTRKRRENCHGNHIEMIALSELYNRPIEVYEYSLGMLRDDDDERSSFSIGSSFIEPINVVQGMYKTDNEPIRLSYHCGVHYNSIIDPWRPTAGHGLGLPDLQPGVRNSVRALPDCLTIVMNI
jgi:OTU domain-containing protein 5